MKKITDFFDNIDSQINAQNYKGLFTDLKEIIENVIDKFSKENLLKQLEDFKQKINLNELIFAFKAHFSPLKESVESLKELALDDNEKMEKTVNDI